MEHAMGMEGLDAGELLPASRVELPEGRMAMVRTDLGLRLAVSGTLQDLFAGEPAGTARLCPLDHGNRLALNQLLPWTKPTAFGACCASFGLGDRLGYANAAQLRSIRKADVRPVLAQQSLRELQLTGRTLTDVVDNAAWAVFREGYREGYACDGDHLKTLEEVQDALAEGATMITLDGSLAMSRAGREQTGEETEAFRRQNGESYSEFSRMEDLKGLGLYYTENLWNRLHAVYDPVVRLAWAVYWNGIVPAGRPVDLEISLDETEQTTTPEAHFFVAHELQRLGIAVTSMAPRFVGEFQKAIDYIGDLGELRTSLDMHARIADRFGYKLSLHSGSEKFSVLPLLAQATGGRCHVKTSGTSWLEAVEVIAKHAPALYRRMHARALVSIEEARQFYEVHCDVSRIPPLESVSDAELPLYLTENDSRQLMHITYGYILKRAELKRDILAFLDANTAVYEAEIEDLYDRHLSALENR